MIEDVLAKLDEFIFLADFIVLDMKEDQDMPLILGRPFLTTGRTLIDVEQGKLILRAQDEQVTFNIFEAIKYLSEVDLCFLIDTISKLVSETFKGEHLKLALETCITHSKSTMSESAEIRECTHYLEATPPSEQVKGPKFEELGKIPSRPKSSIASQT